MNILSVNHTSISPEQKDYYNSLTNLELVKEFYNVMEQMEQCRKKKIKATDYDQWLRNLYFKESKLANLRREQSYLIHLLYNRGAFIDLKPYVKRGE